MSRWLLKDQGDPKEISREATSSYNSAHHGHHRAQWFGQRLCKLSSGHVAINTAFDFDEWARCLGNADMTYVIWMRDYMIQGVSMA
jgi:hypothetical protein